MVVQFPIYKLIQLGMRCGVTTTILILIYLELSCKVTCFCYDSHSLELPSLNTTLWISIMG